MPRMSMEDRKEQVRLTPGVNYRWSVEDAEDLYSKKGGYPQIKLILRVGNDNGKMKIFDSLTFSENAFFRIEQFMKSAGVAPEQGVPFEFTAADCKGLHGVCTVRDEKQKDSDKVYTRIDKWLEANSQEPIQAWIDRAADSPPPGAGYYSEAGPSGDDIPF